ncbi:hypothetical protein MJH12_09365, partial [bacterium]|nr:hypothetical protein [bacterium]
MQKLLFFIFLSIPILLIIFTEYPQIILTQKLPFGDLYQLCQISKFKEETPKLITKHTISKDAKILCFGDSFFASNFGHAPFSSLLQDTRKVKVAQSISLHDYNQKNLQESLKQYEKIEVVILETIERYLYGRFPNPIKLSLYRFDQLFTKREDKLQYLWQANPLQQILAPMIHDFKFHTFGDFPENLLFFKQSRLYLKSTLSKSYLGSSFAGIQESALRSFVDNIQNLQLFLKTKKIRLLVMIIPNKASVELLEESSKSHIVSIQAEFLKRKILYVDLLNAFHK